MDNTLKAKIVVRNDTASAWVSRNPVLLKGEIGYSNNTGILKIGNGVSTWNELGEVNHRECFFADHAPTNEEIESNGIQPGDIWINNGATPPELYVLVYDLNDEASWEKIVTENSLDLTQVMQSKDFAKETGAGKETGYVDKALKADKLTTPRTISLSGDVTGSTTFDGSAPVSIAAALKNSGVAAGTYLKVTVNAKGIITGTEAVTAEDIPDLTLAKITDAGSAASKNAGNAAGQVPVVGADGKLDTSIMPQLVITDTFEAESDDAMLALNAQKGDVCLRSDGTPGMFILAGDDPKVLANWKRVPVPTNAVLSVNGKIGVVVLSTDDIAEGTTNVYFTQNRFDTALAAKSTSDLKEGSNLYFTTARVKAYLEDENNTFILDGGNA